ncbi:PucR family transcriptional regulator [Rhodococcus sp. NPDC003382]|uniref:PucR family transcriptional regulator n=1 Tax=unclassified Rhodococcus (in: high G+C Gram-positive bacteria) TaxID=192944 RepID=UPI0018CCD977|nr:MULTISPECIES: helix-turn-helix domain-containing protein [unclassified Rhodococcus (in: high G+C Gram-positive bacteria)]MBH0118507.1 helix-turn-helix domain-containing protein [Rhodococcus sp. CX]MCK8672495.1 helix-turn-helix domain-containing protein [Rhodococcus sp. HM1]
MTGREVHAQARGGADSGAVARALVAEVAELSVTRQGEIAQAMIDRLTSEIGAMSADRPTRGALDRAAWDGVAVITRFLRDDLDEIEIPDASYGLVRTLARQGLPVTVVDRSNRLAQDCILRWCLEVLAGLGNDTEAVMQAGVMILTKLSAGIDGVSQRLLGVYEAERDMWLFNRNASRSARIHDILAGRPIEVTDAEATLGYRLGQHHLGVMVWTDDTETADNELTELEQAVTTLADYFGAGSRALFEPFDEHTGWAWIPLGGVSQVEFTELTPIVAGWERPFIVSFGDPQDGVDGFVRTHRQAAQARSVAQASQLPGPRFVPISAVGAVALMCHDLDAARSWVGEVLGPLAADDLGAEQLRRTLFEFLSSGGSYIAAATQLHMHRNSVAYRINKAEELLGRSVRESRLDLENALALCHWLGSAVLTAPTATPASAR